MKSHATPFLGLDSPYSDFTKSAVVVLPIPYEGGISYGPGTSQGPQAILEASHHLELYDEVLNAEFYKMGIATVKAPRIPKKPKATIDIVYQTTKDLLEKHKFTVMIGGDHSVTLGYIKALLEAYGNISVIQFDAHADLRDTYEKNPFSHACIMARIRELTTDTLQIGVRSFSAKEARTVEKENINFVTMHNYHNGQFNIKSVLKQLPDPVYISIDVDVFDWSVIRSTGTPEPGGLLWDETLGMIDKIFQLKQVIGFDIVELSGKKNDINSAFAAAKLIYKMIGYKLNSVLKKYHLPWPNEPQGNFFHDIL
jgi:agmatinase